MGRGREGTRERIVVYNRRAGLTFDEQVSPRASIELAAVAMILD